MPPNTDYASVQDQQNASNALSMNQYQEASYTTVGDQDLGTITDLSSFGNMSNTNGALTTMA